MKWYSSSMLLRGHSVSDAMEAIAAAGFDGIEVWVDQANDHGETGATLRRRAAQLGLGTSLHASSYDLNLAAWNRGIRAESQRQTSESVRFAAELGAAVAVVHPGRRSSSRDRVEDYWPIVLESLEPIDDVAHQLGVTVGLELMEKRPKELFMLPDDARRVMEHGYRSTRITVDLAHSWSHYDPVQFLADLDLSWVTHMHLSDSDPRTVHLPLGEGDVDLLAVYRGLVAIGYDGAITIEGYAEGRGAELIEANRRYISRLGMERGAATPFSE
jgi:sugar phosphate isomerase/epimerase